MGRRAVSTRRLARPGGWAPDWLAAYCLLTLVILAIVLAHWPGRLNLDTLGMLRMVRGDTLHDHWSLLPTLVWRQAYGIAGTGPGIALVLQTAMLAAGLYLVLRAALGRISAAAVACVLMFAPPTFGFVGLVGRDAWFVSSCVLAAGLAVAATRWRDRRLRIAAVMAGALAVAVAIAARRNGFTAASVTLTGVAYAGLALVGGRPSLLLRAPRWPIAGALALVTTAVLLVGMLMLATAARERAAHPQIYTHLYDLGYLTLREERRLIPRLPRQAQPVQTVSEVRDRWRPIDSIYMRWFPERGEEMGVRLFYTDAEAERLAAAWRSAIREDPLAYLRGRFGLWRRQIGIGYKPEYAIILATPSNSVGYREPAFPALSDAAASYASHWGSGTGVESRGGGPLHYVWIYLLACLGGSLLALPRFPAAVQMSATFPLAGMGLQVGLFFMAPSAQFRYELLAVYAGMTSLVLLAAVGARAARTRRSAAPSA